MEGLIFGILRYVNFIFITFTLTIIHLVCPPKLWISIVFKVSWEDCKISQEKLETKLIQNIWGGGGGKQGVS